MLYLPTDHYKVLGIRFQDKEALEERATIKLKSTKTSKTIKRKKKGKKRKETNRNEEEKQEDEEGKKKKKKRKKKKKKKQLPHVHFRILMEY